MDNRRKLAAILCADAAGYSRLMADDEAATVRSLNDARALFRERIQAHGGRLIDTAGDSILAEFAVGGHKVQSLASDSVNPALRNPSDILSASLGSKLNFLKSRQAFSGKRGLSLSNVSNADLASFGRPN